MDRKAEWTECAVELGEKTARKYARECVDPCLSLEDLVQVGRIAAWRAAESYRPGWGQWDAWVVWKVKRELVEEMRRLSWVRRSDREAGVLFQWPAPIGEIPEEDLVHPSAEEEMLASPEGEDGWLPELLARLPTRYGEIVRLRLAEGLTFRDCGAHMNCGHGTVRSSLPRATALARMRLEEMGVSG